MYCLLNMNEIFQTCLFSFHKMHLLERSVSSLGPFTDRNLRFSYLSYTWASKIPTVVYTRSLYQKRCPFRAEPSRKKTFSEFTQQDGKALVCDKRDRAIARVFCRDLPWTLMIPGLLQKDLLKERWISFKQKYCHACHTRFAVFFPLRRFSF